MARIRGTSFWSVLALVVYLAAAGIGVVHAAEYGPEDHSHHGQPCQIHHVAKQADALDLPVVASLETPLVVPAVYGRQTVAALAAADFLSYKSRDPPVRLFS